MEDLESLNVLGLLGWLVNARLLRRDLLPRGQVRMMNRLIPLLDLERRLHPPVGLSLVAVARAAGARAAAA